MTEIRLKDAVGLASPGEPLLLYEKLQPVADLLQTLGATPMHPPSG